MLVASHVPVNKWVSAGTVIEQDGGVAPHEEEGDPGAFTSLRPSLAFVTSLSVVVVCQPPRDSKARGTKGNQVSFAFLCHACL